MEARGHVPPAGSAERHPRLSPFFSPLKCAATRSSATCPTPIHSSGFHPKRRGSLMHEVHCARTANIFILTSRRLQCNFTILLLDDVCCLDTRREQHASSFLYPPPALRKQNCMLRKVFSPGFGEHKPIRSL